MQTINEILAGNAYPGRGIILGRSEDNGRAVAVYFIMGRSENSRNRIFTKTEDGIKTEAFDASKLTDPSLVIYHPVRQFGDALIVTNGDQTDTICEHLTSGKKFHGAMMSRVFEPDPPIFTPRISGILRGNGAVTLAIVKNIGGDAEVPAHQFFEYSQPQAGKGHLIHTYSGAARPDGSLESFVGEPRAVKINVADGLETYANEVWNALDAANRVALYAREIVVATGEYREIIINKYK
ncbi:MAG: IMP cyclohydrolase [Oscillospiraceae bacterium]|jgi:IMP cyclohydrolase|nr:IMP cyclohydrolase [Oscillospiraceae bacterium]